MKWENFLVPDEVDLCRLALVLAMTPTQESEREVIAEYQKLGVRGAATTISGFGISGQTGIIRSVVNLCVNTGLIERKRTHVHPSEPSSPHLIEDEPSPQRVPFPPPPKTPILVFFS